MTFPTSTMEEETFEVQMGTFAYGWTQKYFRRRRLFEKCLKKNIWDGFGLHDVSVEPLFSSIFPGNLFWKQSNFPQKKFHDFVRLSIGLQQDKTFDEIKQNKNKLTPPNARTSFSASTFCGEMSKKNFTPVKGRSRCLLLLPIKTKHLEIN